MVRSLKNLEEVKEVYSGLEEIVIDNLYEKNPKLVRDAITGMTYLSDKYGFSEKTIDAYLNSFGSLESMSRGLLIADAAFVGVGGLGYALYTSGLPIAGLTLLGVSVYNLIVGNAAVAYFRKKGSKGAKKLFKYLPVYNYFKKKGIEGIKDFLKNPNDNAFQIDNKVFLRGSTLSTLYLASGIELADKGNPYLTALGAILGVYGLYSAAKTGYLFAKMRNKLKH